eukprot:CAMPEP_0172524936 /NCGR_PEP_ID=MMETSP1066-20121228/294452_1 /TAXON_ID=671091 /ORGANISM="Coscinodiscus wailesii, Strain CCMP2513" /LENGTH=62 /DNA_ID=CAMNT_0013308093 /DNA_START=469 /DNA_END=658 /DNA_ORIENTATION=+
MKRRSNENLESETLNNSCAENKIGNDTDESKKMNIESKDIGQSQKISLDDSERDMCADNGNG